MGMLQDLRVQSLSPCPSSCSVALSEEDALDSKVGPVSPDPPSPQGPFPTPVGSGPLRGGAEAPNPGMPQAVACIGGASATPHCGLCPTPRARS